MLWYPVTNYYRRTADGTDTCRTPKGSRITDYLSLGVVAKTFPAATVKSVLEAAGRGSRRM